MSSALMLALLAAIIAYGWSTATAPDATATGQLGFDDTAEPSSFREAVRNHQIDLLTSDDAIRSLVDPDQAISVRARPNLTFIDLTVTGPDEAAAISSVDALMAALIQRNLEEHQAAPTENVARLLSQISAQEAEIADLLLSDNAIDIANRRGLLEALSVNRTRLEAEQLALDTARASLVVVQRATPTKETSQASFAAIAAFAGVLLAALAITAGDGHD